MSSYVPCPKCQNPHVTPVNFTWWGGVLGPKMLHHVSCSQCGTKYNGKTGGSNAAAITVYVIVGAIVFFVAITLIRTLI